MKAVIELVDRLLIDVYGYYKNSAKLKNGLITTAAALIHQYVEQEVGELHAEMDRSIEHGKILI